jgi:hypothetical protein
MQLWLFLAVSCKSVKLNEDTTCFSIYINEACSKSNVQRTLWHNNYYHRDTTACTHADIIKLFFNITTPVELHVPAIYTTAVKSWSRARNNAVTAPHYHNHNHHDPQAVVPINAILKEGPKEGAKWGLCKMLQHLSHQWNHCCVYWAVSRITMYWSIITPYNISSSHAN